MKPTGEPGEASEEFESKLERNLIFAEGVEEEEGYRAFFWEMMKRLESGELESRIDLDRIEFGKLDVPGLGEIDIVTYYFTMTVRFPPIHPEAILIDIVKRIPDA